MHPNYMATQKQYYGNCVANFENLCDDLQTAFVQAQAVIEQKFATVNDKLAIINAKLTKLEKVPDQLFDFFAKFIATHSQEYSFPQEGVESSHSTRFHSNTFVQDLHLPKVDVDKFDGSNSTGWVTQLEHYFSLYGITNDLMKLCVVSYIYSLDGGNGGNVIRNPIEVILLGHNLSKTSMNALK